MAGQIIWNGTTIAFSRIPEAWAAVHKNVTTRVETAGGKVVSLHRSRKTSYKILVKLLTEEQERQFTNFWYWASKGGEFAAAFSSGQVSSTTLDGTVSGTTVPLTATTGMTAGDRLLLISDDREHFEEVIIASVSAGISIAATVSLTHNFVSGDACRHALYLPYAKLVTLDKSVVEAQDNGKTNTRSATFTIEESIQ